MLYNLLFNSSIKRTIALDANEGLDDLAFENGWRIVLNAAEERRISKEIHRQSVDEWRRYLANLAGDDWLMVDNPMFTPYYEDGFDEDDEDTWSELDDPTDDADGIADFGPSDQSYDMEETFHFLNNQ
jgi:hypothetical protein